MAEFTLTIKGTPDELREILAQLHMPAEDGTVTSGDAQSKPKQPLQPWSEEEIADLWRNLQPDARKLLAEIAKRPAGYPFDQLQKVMGLNGNQVGGRLSSLGHQETKYTGRKPILSRDWQARQYTMDEEAARFIRKLEESSKQ